MRLRPRLNAITLFITFSLWAINAGECFEAAVRAPVNCSNGASCGHDVRLSTVMDSAHKYSESVVKCRQNQKSTSSQCLIPAAIDHNICGEPTHFYYSWARVEDISDGQAALLTLKKYVEAGKPFGEYHKLIVEVAGAPKGEQHLALCYASGVKDVAGPPSNCTTVAIITPGATFLRGGVDQTSCFASASIRLDTGVIDILYNIKTKLDVNVFAASLKRMLSDKLGLTVDSDTRKADDGHVYSVSMRSAAPLRNSKILPGGWRESFAFDLEVGLDDKSIKVTGSSEPMICRQASGNLIDYQAPDDAQRGLYARALDSMVGDALVTVCNKYQKVDSKNLVCE